MNHTTYEQVLTRAEWQENIFAERLSQRRLRALRPGWSCRSFRLRVHRNHGFEFVAGALPPFLAFARLEAEVELGSYDDALSLALDGSSDLELVWLDFDRYGDRLDNAQLVHWVIERMAVLRSRSNAPILLPDRVGPPAAVADFNRLLRKAAQQVAGLQVCPLSELGTLLGPAYFDDRMVDLSASRLSRDASLQTARALGLQWIPSVLSPRLKAVVFDLDHTLWAGVLGEDGIGGVVVTPGHAKLQQHALQLASEGIFLGLASKNEEADVEKLFAERSGDLPLPLSQVSARAISWDAKAHGLKHILEVLRIGPDAVLFVDDNPGELAAVGGALNGIWTLQASPDPTATLRALQLHPGLLRWTADDADTLRASDLAASALRSIRRADAGDPLEYLTSLQVCLGHMRDPVAHRTRLHALSNKTNQFNLAMGRLTEAEVDRRLADRHTPVVALWLSDRLSDSGLIGALFARVEGTRLVVDELCVSCRALGRGLEDALVTTALVTACAPHPEVRELVFCHTTGPRNGPARSWLAAFAEVQLVEEEGSVTIPWEPAVRSAMLHRLPIEIEDRGDR